jgi:hypothetical protein
VGDWAGASVARWPKFQPKSSKGAGEKKKKSWLEEFGSELWPNFAEKGPKKILKEFPSWPNFFHVLARKKFRDLATLAAATHGNS